MLFLKGLSLNLTPLLEKGSKQYEKFNHFNYIAFRFFFKIPMSSYPTNVIVLIGATASGKTELAIEIAEYLKTNIHNIDSRQIYKFMDIGTAKPSKT